MFRFKEYLKENYGPSIKFKKGDKVIYVGDTFQFSYYKDKKFSVEEVDSVGLKPYLIKCIEPGNFSSFKVSADEIILSDEDIIKVGDTVLYRTTRTTSKRSNNKVGTVVGILNNEENFRLSFPDGDIVVASKNEITKHDIDKPIPPKKPKKGDLVLFNTKKEYFKRLNGKIGVVDSTNYNSYQVKFDGEQYNTYCDLNELTVVDIDFRIVIGSKVIVNGKQGNVLFRNRQGIVKRINRDKNGNPEAYFIKFEEDESKNMREFSMMIDKEYVEYVEKTSDTKKSDIEKGDSVVCTKPGIYFDKTGVVTKVWDDGEYSVNFPGSTNYILILKSNDIKLVEADDFTKKIKEKIKSKESTKVSEQEEEEEEDISSVKPKTDEEEDFEIDKEDLLKLSYDEFFLEEKLVDKEEFIKKKKEYENVLSKEDISPFKKDFYERSLKLADLVEQYFNFIEAKVVKDGGKLVFRTLEQIESEILLSNGTKVRASDSKEITKKYSFDSGIIVYWEFEDAVVFKTI